MKPTTVPERGGLRGLIFDNIGLKITSLVAAVALFSIVRGAEDAQRSVYVDVIATLPPPSSARMLMTEVPDRVHLTLRGSRALLNSLRRDDIPPVQIDLTNGELRTYYFDAEVFEIPAGLEVVQFAPATVPLTWADRLQRTLPVHAVLEGSPTSGLMLMGSPLVRPATIELSGPSPAVAPLEALDTDPIDITALGAGRHELRVALARVPDRVDVLGDRNVTVVFEIAPQVAERDVPRLEIAVIGGAVREIRPARVRVALRGAPDELDELDALGIVPYIDASALDPARGAQSVIVRVRGIPDGIELAGVEPEEVLVTPTPVAPPPHR